MSTVPEAWTPCADAIAERSKVDWQRQNSSILHALLSVPAAG